MWASKDDMDTYCSGRGWEALAMGHLWDTLKTLAQDHLRWRDFVTALVVYDKKGAK